MEKAGVGFSFLAAEFARQYFLTLHDSRTQSVFTLFWILSDYDHHPAFESSLGQHCFHIGLGIHVQ